MFFYLLLQVKVFTVQLKVLELEDVSSFEVGWIDENLPEDKQQWEVVGWQSREDINKLITELKS